MHDRETHPHPARQSVSQCGGTPINAQSTKSRRAVSTDGFEERGERREERGGREERGRKKYLPVVADGQTGTHPKRPSLPLSPSALRHSVGYPLTMQLKCCHHMHPLALAKTSGVMIMIPKESRFWIVKVFLRF